MEKTYEDVSLVLAHWWSRAIVIRLSVRRDSTTFQ